ncbi:hypothetical protein [Mesomycoplasma ovipneumoniae]|nr:hypothetical protein [Mesomycoplasma ovipneumoniae]MDW2834063.1 hypothetical protein [Mesomycoplasma ovipneumoniae]WNM13284.1 hypothetical protein RNL84_02800 [Mesomycoplasma ovipneumoniae]
MKFLDLNLLPELDTTTSLTELENFSKNEIVNFATLKATWICIVIVTK